MSAEQAAEFRGNWTWTVPVECISDTQPTQAGPVECVSAQAGWRQPGCGAQYSMFSGSASYLNDMDEVQDAQWDAVV